MNIILDSPTAKIWSDSNAPYAFSILFSWPASKSEFDQIVEKYTALIKKVKSTFGEVYSICDLSHPPTAPAKEMIPIFESCIEKQLKLGIKRKAFVLPQNFSGSLFKPEIERSEQISFHQNFQQALTEINQIRINGINASMSVL